jgi:thiamine kinase-like enzyme
MSTPLPTSGTPDVDESLDTLTALVAREFPGLGLQSVSRQPSPFATLSPAEVLSLALTDGRHVRLFVKHLGSEQPGQPDKQRRDREIRVYEDLLRHAADLPVPRYYGFFGNKVTQRQEIYLEHIDDWTLRYQNLQHWFTAAARLADLHAHFANRLNELRASDFLLKLDAAYFAGWAERAEAAVAQQAPLLCDRMVTLGSKYDVVCDFLATQPLTLVHNDLACKNVIADRSHSPSRICFVDWELAGIGCGLLDLVHLKYGLDPANDAAMVATYCDRLRSTDLLPNDSLTMSRLLAACELHKTLYRLAHSPGWNLSPDGIAKWVMEAEIFLERTLEP